MSGSLIDSNGEAAGALHGDMNVRIAENILDPGETVITREVVLLPFLDFGNCKVFPSNFFIFENKFSAEGLDMAGTNPFLGFGIAYAHRR